MKFYPEICDLAKSVNHRMINQRSSNKKPLSVYQVNCHNYEVLPSNIRSGKIKKSQIWAMGTPDLIITTMTIRCPKTIIGIVFMTN